MRVLLILCLAAAALFLLSQIRLGVWTAYQAGRLILHAGGEDIDITDDLEREGVYCYIYEMEVVRGDGSRELRPVTVNVTGTPEDWTATQDNGDGSCTTITSSDGRAPVGPG